MAAVMAACSSETDFFEKQSQEPIIETPKQHAEKVLGFTIDANQDWVLTQESKVSIKADAAMTDIAQVMVLSGNPYLEQVSILGKADAKKGATAMISFRAPVASKMLYAACVSKDGDYRVMPFGIGQSEAVSFVEDYKEAEEPAATRGAFRAVSSTLTEPESTLNAEKFGWTDTKQYIKNIPTVLFESTILSELQQEAHQFLPEGKTNYDSIAAHANVQNYAMVQVGDEPSEVKFVFIGGASNSQDKLGYYYYQDEADAHSAPKYIIDRHYDPYNYFQTNYGVWPNTYTTHVVKLLYKQPSGELTTIFPAGTKVSFFIERDYYSGDAPVAFYGQGQLNKEVCQWLGDNTISGHYDQSFAQHTDRQRLVVFSINGHNFLSCEDWTDWDFNDKIFWVDGVKPAPAPVPVKPVSSQVWSYAFEDTNMGDYDMNDVVLKVKENASDASKLDVTLAAVGAMYNIWVEFAANGQDVFGKEVHDVLGMPRKSLVNTQQKDVEPVTVTVSKPAGFDFQTSSFRILVEDASGFQSRVEIATLGQEPHGIVIPADWSWPTERTCITAAYPKFAQWAKDITNESSKDWYLYPAEGKVMNIQ